MEDGQRRPRILILADECNPEWPSLPIVGYKYALEIAKYCDVTVATHIRNRENIEKAGPAVPFVYIDNEYIASPMYKLAKLLRGGEEVGWSISMMFNYLPYLAFEWGVWRKFRAQINRGEFDIIHRITPMSPTLPSYIAGKGGIPFVIGPLNGNLPWPSHFSDEQNREKEGMRRFRDLYKLLPFAQRAYKRASCVLYGFDHTRKDIENTVPADKLVMMPEIGFDPEIFHAVKAKPAGARNGKQLRFLYAGRLVPYKLPEVVVQAFAKSERLRQHKLHIIGDGPELPRIEQVVAENGLEDCVVLEGRKTQKEVADRMRESDAFVFPSIRELGAGVIIEAMATGALCIVVDYGAPGALAASERGIRVEMGPFDKIVEGFVTAMESCIDQREMVADRASRAKTYAEVNYPWTIKGQKTHDIYQALLDRSDLSAHNYD